MVNFEIIVPYDWGESRWEELKEIASRHGKIAWALHDIDSASSFKHYHLGCHMNSDNTIATVAGWFGFEQNQIQKIRSQFDTYLTYLLHKTKGAIDENKTPPIAYGGDYDFSKAEVNYNSTLKDNEILLQICNGTIKEYQFVNKLTDEFRLKNHIKIQEALKIWRDKKMATSMTHTKTVYWIHGKAGVGKTTLAKWLCKNMDYYMSDSGANPFDNYHDQPCIILDDVGSDNLNGKVVLKLFDPHNKCFTSARYYNKPIDAETIVVTSSMDPRTFWDECRNKVGCADGSWEQLLRRLTGGVYEIKDKGSFEFTMYDSNGENPCKMTLAIPSEVGNITATVSAESRMNDIMSKLNFTVTQNGSRVDFSGSLDEIPFE